MMPSIHVDIEEVEWTSAVPFYGPGAVHDGRDIIALKVLSDRRADGGGIVWLAKFSPPQGKLIKIVATALSDEHALILEGGRATKSGERRRAAAGYSLNPKGQPHSAMIAEETLALIIYAGEPDEIHSLELIDLAPAAG
jgi:hypothetical protein